MATAISAGQLPPAPVKFKVISKVEGDGFPVAFSVRGVLDSEALKVAV